MHDFLASLHSHRIRLISLTMRNALEIVLVCCLLLVDPTLVAREAAALVLRAQDLRIPFICVINVYAQRSIPQN